MLTTLSAVADPQAGFDAAVVMPTILRPSLGRAVRSVFRQDLVGRIQLLVGIDVAAGDRRILDELAAECPPHIHFAVFDPGYSTSVRHGGLHTNRFSGALRTILSFAANARRIAYLDDDNWWAPEHLATLSQAIDGHDYAWSRRWFVEPVREKPVCIDEWESLGPGLGVFNEKFGGFIDPSSLMIDKLACPDIAPLWAMSPFEDGSGEDRLVFEALRAARRGRSSGVASSYYRIDPRDSMHLNRVQAFRERGIELPAADGSGAVALADAVAPFRIPAPLAPEISVPDDLLLTEIVARLKPREIVALGAGDGETALSLTVLALARGLMPLTFVAGAGPDFAARVASTGLAGAVAIPPAELGDAWRWLAASGVSVDLVHVGTLPAASIAEAATVAWLIVRPGGLILGEGAAAAGTAVGEALRAFAAAQNTQVLPVTLGERERWLIQKDENAAAVPASGAPWDAKFDEALACHRAGDIANASRLYQELLNDHPDHAPSLHLLGTIALQIGQADLAVRLIEAAIAADGRVSSFHNDLGEALRLSNRMEEASAAFLRALELDANNAAACNNLGIVRQGQGRIEEAAALYRQAVAASPAEAGPRANLGAALLALGHLGEAAEVLEAAVALKPDAPALLMLGNARFLAGQPEQAETLYRQVLAMNPDSVEAHVNLARTLTELGSPQAALAEYAAARLQAGDHPSVRFNEGLCRLLLGDLPAGWGGFARRTEAGAVPPHGLTSPLWDGGDLTGKRLLIHAEQGLGDTLQFLRFLPRLRSFAPEQVSLVCQAPLLSLLDYNRREAGVDLVTGPDGLLPAHECRFPLLDLPGLFGIGLDDLPGRYPYLEAQPDRRDIWRERLKPLTGPRIGLVWKGRPEHGNDANRSIPARVLAPLLRLLPNFSFVSLQKGAGEVEIATFAANGFIADLGPELAEMADSAALIAELDLVISVDTAIAHLTGALGKPLYLLLPFAPDWRWLLDRADSPWYPSARLFRQEARGNWASVVATVAEVLQSTF